jgi:signal peptide peptidase SppA
MIDLPFVASRVFGTPLMIARGKLEVILTALAPRFAGTAAQAIPVDPARELGALVTADGIAVVPVIGTLVTRSGYLSAASGLSPYGAIGDAIASAFEDPAVRGIVLEIDSPGGEVGGLFDLVQSITSLKAASDKPIWAAASEGALSAAYAIASAADQIYVTQTGEVGSIGVVAVHVDESAADAKAGLAWSFVFAGDRKIDGNPHQPLSDRARGAIQLDVDRLYEQFASLVSQNRGLTPEAVRGTQAAIYRGELAVRAGLADRVGTLATAIADMTAELDQQAASSRTATDAKRSPIMSKTKTAPESTGTVPQPALEAPAAPENPPVSPEPEPASAPEPTPPPSHLGPVSEAHSAVRLRAEFAAIAALAAQAARLGVTVDAADAMRKGISADALRRSILDTLAARAEATSVIAAAPSTTAAGDSPIVRRAKERATAART